MRRSHRTLLERLKYFAAYRCQRCHLRVRTTYLEMLPALKHVSSPKCGWYDLSVLGSRDRIDRLTRNPLRLLLRFIGGRLYHCEHCRFQFYDLRRSLPFKQKKKAAGAGA